MAAKKTAKKKAKKSRTAQTLEGRLKAVEQKLKQVNQKRSVASQLGSHYDKQREAVNVKLAELNNEVASLEAAKAGIQTEINAANQPVQPANVG
jgi:chromosome segregation ATPase